jgi:hypothetical protein
MLFVSPSPASRNRTIDIWTALELTQFGPWRIVHRRAIQNGSPTVAAIRIAAASCPIPLTIRALPSVFVVVTIAFTSSAASSVSATRSGLRTDFVGAAFAGTSIGEHLRHLPIPGARNPTPKPTASVIQPTRNAHSTQAFWRDKSGRGWRWEESDGGHRLLDRQGRTAAWIEGGFGNGNWRIIHPRAYPVPAPVPDLETAKRRFAIWHCGPCRLSLVSEPRTS